jgi:mannosyltransferase
VLGRLREIGVPEDIKIVGCVGRLAYIKGIDLFLAAAERLAPQFPGWAFVIKGDGPMRDSLKSAIKEKRLSERVFLLTNEMDPRELPALYHCFDIFALPTRREGFGMVFAEAMAMGVPVIAPRMAPVTEVVPENCGLLIEPNNVNALKCALGELMADASLRTALAEKGRSHALVSWCGQQAAERVLDVYRELISSSLVTS